jgi:hypothetical protein
MHDVTSNNQKLFSTARRLKSLQMQANKPRFLERHPQNVHRFPRRDDAKLMRVDNKGRRIYHL